MAVKHSAGPWDLFTPNPDWMGRRVSDWAVTIHEHDTWICTGPTWDDLHKEESLANARLIAAAPELLDMLVRLVSENDSASSDPVASQWPNSPMRDEALILIAKATGEKP